MIPLSRAARDRYHFDDGLITPRGGIAFPNFHAARTFAQHINQRRDLVRRPEQAVRPGQANALALLDDILRHVVALYCQQHNPQLFEQMRDWLDEHLGSAAVQQTLHAFVDEFPAPAVYRGEIEAAAYLEQPAEEGSRPESTLLDLLMVWLTNRNPAVTTLADLFDDSAVGRRALYGPVIESVRQFLETQEPFGPDRQSLFDLLRSPALAMPHSLAAQLDYIRARWGHLVGTYLIRLLGGLDLIREEERERFTGPGPSVVPEFRGLGLAPENFSPDRDWMPRLVLLAKNIYVWLDQLSKQHGRPLTRLDQVPDEALDAVARQGFTGLWLIGLWERSPASRRIKQMCGNPEAVASAYSIFDYQIAADLGGSEAYEHLKQQAAQRGIRLASDMVPNHMGIDSPWVIEHPDWFIGLDHSPFPSYTFNGPNLSQDERVGIYLEDHYYNRSDAAVVFKRVDHWTGSERYIYHGNDGTTMPWNDTAQLDYLNPDVREAVIRTILHVARQFPVIRFDAAMTLARQHFQRLWFPEPGSGGAIPSRAERAMTQADFDAAMPHEFWREVVDRVAAEAPDTLLLAEAFWLMEAYFVRTLGMHRVYNSAFMNMLRDEDNARYRQLIQNTLAFDPRILRRYVNFMNNPDERTAVDQFGKGDKYFGICTLLATLPGLPMFGHGQIEGFAEKYGMEYRRAYWEEQPDRHLVERHERQIFPLLRRRHLFAEVENFRLYNLVTARGDVSEDVLAYSNRLGDQRSLVIYHNRYAEARGWLRPAPPSGALDREEVSTEAGRRHPIVQSLCEGLGLHPAEGRFVIFRDHVSNLEYIRSSQGLCDGGLYVELGAYQSHVFLDFHEVTDDDHHPYAQLAASLDGRGVPSIDEALWEMVLQPLHEPFRRMVNPQTFRRLLEARALPAATVPRAEDLTAWPADLDGGRAAPVAPDRRAATVELLDGAEQSLHDLLVAVRQAAGGPQRSGQAPAAVAALLRSRLEALLNLPLLAERCPNSEASDFRWAVGDALDCVPLFAASDAPAGSELAAWGTLFGWLFVHALGLAVSQADSARLSRSWIDEWRLGKIIADTLQGLGIDDGTAWQAVDTIKVLTSHQGRCDPQAPPPRRAYDVARAWLQDEDTQRYLNVNRHQEVLWFSKEAFERLLSWSVLTEVLICAAEAPCAPPPAGAETDQSSLCITEHAGQLRAAAESSGYRVDNLLSILEHT